MKTTKFICPCGCKERVSYIFLLANGDIEIYACKKCGLMFVSDFYNFEFMVESNKEEAKEKGDSK